MVTGVNWGLGAPVDVGGMIRQGFEQGKQIRAQNALASYAQDPTPEKLNALAPYDPKFVLGERDRQRQLVETQQHRELAERAAAGDMEALSRLAGIDPNLWSKMDGRRRDLVKQATGFMGQAVLQVSRLPEDQRAGAWASYVQQAEASGMDIPAQYERYSPEALNAAAAEAGTMERLIKQFEPDYRAVPQGGYLENVNPLSRSTPVPSGPESMPAPPPGFVIDGGPTPSASGGFQPKGY